MSDADSGEESDGELAEARAAHAALPRQLQELQELHGPPPGPPSSPLDVPGDAADGPGDAADGPPEIVELGDSSDGEGASPRAGGLGGFSRKNRKSNEKLRKMMKNSRKFTKIHEKSRKIAKNDAPRGRVGGCFARSGPCARV